MTTTNGKPQTWFWIVSAVALVWNLMGVMAYISQVTMSLKRFRLYQKTKEHFTNQHHRGLRALLLLLYGVAR